ncbi:MAG TPA: hypothetical protein VLM37_11775 [Fibrobacteraceae bacterium]|nr:hypothetical protein [Fibrobacteraceae bacterium]
MISSRDFLLLVAGESSGDRLGAILVPEILRAGLEARGSGGEAMKAAGLLPLIPFTDLPASGFWDVLRRLSRLYRHLRSLRAALHRPQCRGLVCIDYPGFNLSLMAEADRLKKPVFWVAPPQIWAWKLQRGRLFQGREVSVFFDFEQAAYERWEAYAVRVEHPLLAETRLQENSGKLWALMPGSRWPQARRNLRAYQQIGTLLEKLVPGSQAVWVAADDFVASELRILDPFTPIRLASEGEMLWSAVRAALCTPGTVSLELALRGIPASVFSRIDPLTWFVGKLRLRIPSLALPNLILRQNFMPEYIGPAWGGFPGKSEIKKMAESLAFRDPAWVRESSSRLRGLLRGPALTEVFSHFIQRIA